MKRQKILVITIIFTILSSFILTGLGQAQGSATLEFLDEEIKFSLVEGQLQANTIVQNKGEALSDLSFVLLIKEGKDESFTSHPLRAEIIEGNCNQEGTECNLGDSGVFQIKLTVEDFQPDQEKSYSAKVFGESASAGFISEVVGAAIDAKETAESQKPKVLWGLLTLNFNNILTYGLLAGILTAVIALAFSQLGFPRVFSGYAGKIEFDTKKNWLATIVGIGGILGTLSAEKILPESFQLFTDAGEITLLSTIALLLITISPFAVIMLSAIFGRAEKAELTRNGAFLIGLAFLAWAVAAEVLAAMVLAVELGASGKINDTSAGIMQVILFVLGLFALFYAAKKVGTTIKNAALTYDRIDQVDNLLLAIRDALEQSKVVEMQRVLKEEFEDEEPVGSDVEVLRDIKAEYQEISVMSFYDTFLKLKGGKKPLDEKGSQYLLVLFKGLVDIRHILDGSKTDKTIAAKVSELNVALNIDSAEQLEFTGRATEKSLNIELDFQNAAPLIYLP